MSQTLMTILAVASFVLFVDQTTTWLRKRVRWTHAAPDPSPNGAESKGFKDGLGNVAAEYVWRFTTGHW